MEFPHIGSNCSEKSCKQLDFLPVKCDACSLSFCREHYRYASHNCSNQYLRDKQVPVCPLCSRPIPLLPGEVADVKVGAHIDSDCQSDPARERRGKVYAHRCSLKGCKVKEVVPMLCKQCSQNYCLRHRHEADHSCASLPGSDRSTAASGAAALNSSKASVPAASVLSSGKLTAKQRGGAPPALAAIGRELDMERQRRAAGAVAPATRVAAAAGIVQQGAGSRASVSAVHAVQGTMTEDEALRLATAASLQDSSEHDPRSAASRLEQEEQDLALARALAASEEEEARRRRQLPQQQQQAAPSESRCHVS